MWGARVEELGYILFLIFILLLFAYLLGHLMKKIGMPAIVGQILAGAIFVNLVFLVPELGEILHFDPVHFVENNSHFLNIVGEIGVIFLLFTVGLDTRIKDLLKVGRAATYVAVLSIIFSMLGGYLYGIAMGFSFNVSLMIGTAMFAMSTTVAVEVLRTMHALNSKEAKVIIGAAIIDDIICLTILSVVTNIVSPSASTESIVLNTLVVLIFVFVSFVSISRIRSIADAHRKVQLERRRKGHKVAGDLILQEGKIHEDSINEASANATAVAILVCIGLAVLSTTIGLAGIIGAFLAGMIFAEFKDIYPVSNSFNVLTAFMLPFFFIYVGMMVNLSTVTLDMIVILLGMTVVAIVTIFLGGYMGARLGRLKRSSSLVIGSSMIARGEVGIIVATIGLTTGLFDSSMFTVLVLMIILTSLIGPPMITWSYGRLHPEAIEHLEVEREQKKEEKEAIKEAIKSERD